MSVANAIQMGSAFVEFFADAERLWSDISALGSDVKSWAGDVSTQLAAKLAGGYERAEEAVNGFAHRSLIAMTDATSAMETFGATSAASMGGAAAAMEGVEQKAFRIPNLFEVAGKSVGFLTGQLGNIARGAALGSAGLFLVSKIGKALGYEVPPQIDKIRGTLFKVALAANVARLGLFAIKLPGSIVGGVVGGLGKMAGALGRFGRRGMMLSGGGGAVAAAVSAVPEQTGEAMEEETGGESGGGFKQYLAPILTGLMIGSPIGAAAGLLGVFIGKKLKEGGEEGGNAFTGLIARARAWGEWIMGMFTQVKDKIVSTFEKVTAGSEPFLSRLEKAMIPLTHAIENVWLPATLNAIEMVGNFFATNNRNMEDSWSTWILNGISAVGDFVGNFGLYFQIAQQTIVKWASNGILLAQDLFTNMFRWVEWFGENWYDVMWSYNDLIMTIWINSLQNLKDLFFALWEWVKTGGMGEFEYDFTPLTKGFHSTIKEWPDLVQTELAQTTPELDKLYRDLEKRHASAADAMAKNDLIKQIDTRAQQIEADIRRTEYNPVAAISARSQEGYSLLAKLQNQTSGRDPVAENTKKAADETAKMRRAVERSLENKEGGLLPWMIPG